MSLLLLLALVLAPHAEARPRGPNPPRYVSATLTPAGMQLTWHAPRYARGVRIVGYIVYRAAAFRGPYRRVSRLVRSGHYLDRAAADTPRPLYYRVQAVARSQARSWASRPVPPLVIAPAAPDNLTVTAADMTNVLRWDWPDARAGLRRSQLHAAKTIGYWIYRAERADGPFVRLNSRLVTDRSHVDPVVDPAPAYYYVVAQSRTGALSAPSGIVANDRVAMSTLVDETGATLRAANGVLTLTIPAGALTDATLIGVTEKDDAPPPAGAIRVADCYDFSPDGLILRVPAQVTIDYQIPVAHFQVKQRLAPYVNLVTYEPAVRRWVAQATSVDTLGGVFSGPVTHFSYWSGEVVQPHGVRNKVGYCMVCHSLVQGENDYTPVISTDKTVCYNCHGNETSAQPPAGTNGQNIEAEFYDCDDQSFNAATQSRHPVPEGLLYCVRCHTPHRDPAHYYKLLSAVDAVSATPVEPSRDTSSVGAAYCWACHGTMANLAVEISDPGYWLRSGGDHKTNMLGTPHATVTAPTPAAISCNGCHTAHASSTTALVRTSVVGTDTANDKTLCTACHAAASAGYPTSTRLPSSSANAGYPTSGTWPGKAAYDASAHDSAQLVWPGSDNAPGACTNCHGPHGTGRLDMLSTVYESPKSYETTRSHEAFAQCIDACHDADGPGPDIASSYESTATHAGHRLNRSSKSVSDTSTAYLPQGAKLPCWECHNPHGSTKGNYKMAPDELAPGSITTARGMCVRCHRPSDSADATPTVAGLKLKKLPATVAQHAQADTASCLPCHGNNAHAAARHGGGDGDGECAACHGQTGSHSIHINATDPRGPVMNCSGCHDVNNYPGFADGKNLAQTDVCDTCHSPGGDYDGVNDATIGAKPNWSSKVYETTATIQAGKGKWCAGCHDKSPSQVRGVSAPKVIGDESASYIYGTGYGFYKTGHGVPTTAKIPANGYEPGPDLTCDACHNSAERHIDGLDRSYVASGTPTTYRTGYRLDTVSGQEPMNIPRDVPPRILAGDGEARLCFKAGCHAAAAYVSDGHQTNFYLDAAKSFDSVLFNSMHAGHMYVWSAGRWASDWSSNNDSRLTCPTCHNVHGSKYLSMVRDGELVSREVERRPGLRIWYKKAGVSSWTEGGTNPPSPEDITLPMSDGWVWDKKTGDNICVDCHGGNMTGISRSLKQGYSIAPALGWTGGPGYGNDGADPDSGPGDPGFVFKIKYSDANNDPPSYVRLRIDKNDDGDYLDAGETVAMDEDVPGDTTYFNGKLYHTDAVLLSKAGDNVLPYYFETSDGSQVTTGPAQRTITITNAVPTLPWTDEPGYTIDGVDPNSGQMNSTNFEFRIKYRDTDGEAPVGGVKLHIDKNDDGDYLDPGELITMNDMGDPSYVLGKRYNHTTTLGYGNDGLINYYFEATDGIDTAMSTVCTVTVTTAANAAPSLAWTGEASYTGDGVDPDRAAATKPFFFRVKYSDADNDAPNLKQVWLDKNDDGDYLDAGEKIAMDDAVGVPPNDGDYSNGEIFAEKIYISYAGDGTLNYCFYFTDANDAEATGVQLTNKTLTVFEARDVPGEFGSIQSAIATATAGETILVANGTYAPFSFDNRDITVESVNGPASAIIDGGGSGTVVSFNQYSGNSTDSTLTGFTLRNGSRGVSTANSWARLVDCIIENNTAYGVEHTCNSTYPITLDDCVVRNNTGPGLYVANNTAIVTITDTSFTGNTAGSGGAIQANGGNVTIERCTLSGNSATANNGGALYAGGTFTLNLRDSTITSNTAVLDGGGLYFSGAGGTNVTAVRNVLAGNSAANGGAIRTGQGNYYFTNCTMSSNRASGTGGAIHVQSGTNANFTNCTVAGNEAASGGGMRANTSANGHPKVHNCIFWGNNSSASAYEQIDSDSDMNRNRIQVRYTDIDQTFTNFFNQAGNITANPLFVSSASYTLAPTTAGNYHLQSGSPCIGQADASIAPDDDIDGDSRLPHIAGTNDMGSDEFMP